MHRTFAKLYELKSDFKEAINELKTSVQVFSCRYTWSQLNGGQNIPMSHIITFWWEKFSQIWAINLLVSLSSLKWLKFGTDILKISLKNHFSLIFIFQKINETKYLLLDHLCLYECSLYKMYMHDNVYRNLIEEIRETSILSSSIIFNRFSNSVAVFCNSWHDCSSDDLNIET